MRSNRSQKNTTFRVGFTRSAGCAEILDLLKLIFYLSSKKSSLIHHQIKVRLIFMLNHRVSVRLDQKSSGLVTSFWRKSVGFSHFYWSFIEVFRQNKYFLTTSNQFWDNHLNGHDKDKSITRLCYRARQTCFIRLPLKRSM